METLIEITKSVHFWCALGLVATVVTVLIRNDNRLAIFMTVALAALYIGRELIVPLVALSAAYRTDLEGEMLASFRQGLGFAWEPVMAGVYKLLILIPLVAVCVRGFKKRETQSAP